MEKVSYALGMSIANNLKHNGVDNLNIEDFVEALRAVTEGKHRLLIFYNLFCLFIGIFTQNRLLSDSFERRAFRRFRPCLWLIVWSEKFKKKVLTIRSTKDNQRKV